MAIAPPSPYGYAASYTPTPTKKKTESDWERALRLRSEGLNTYYNLPAVSAVPPPAAGAASSIGPPVISLPGWEPDYKAILAGDPTLLGAEGDLTAYTGQLAAARKAAVQQAVIAAGLDPGGVTGDVDAQTLDAARTNKFSAAADLERQRSRADADVAARLAGRGVLSSGATRSSKQRVQEGYEGATSKLTQDLLRTLGLYQGDYAEKYAGARQQYNVLREQAAARIANDPRYQPLGATDAVLDPSSGLYMTSDGRWYNAQGQRVSAPAAPAAQAAAPQAASVLDSIYAGARAPSGATVGYN